MKVGDLVYWVKGEERTLGMIMSKARLLACWRVLIGGDAVLIPEGCMEVINERRWFESRWSD
jgi:hypothetical protein